MDFDRTPEHAAVAELAARLLADRSTPEALRQVEQEDPDRFDRDLWATMAGAGLLGLAVPERHGGAGLGLVELCAVLEEVGRRTAAVPAIAALALGALPIARFGSEAQQARLLPALSDGRTVLTAALAEPLGDVVHPTVTATADGNGWRLDGVRGNVPAGHLADAVLVPASAGGRPAVFVVDATADGLARVRQHTTSGTPQAQLTLDGVRVGEDAVLGSVEHGAAVLGWMVDHATVAACAVLAGVTAEALRITGAYTVERQQFGQPLAGFQAVKHRAADAYVDAQAVSLTMQQAAWRLTAGLPADREVATAKYWASAAGHRVVHAAVHLHGGMGVDRDYPLHRYFLWAKQLELFLGGATPQLLRLGDILAAEGATRP